MRKPGNKQLLDKYINGQSDLSEEKALFDLRSDNDKAFKAWSIYREQQIKQVPEELKSSIRSSMRVRRNKQKFIKTAIFSAAAMIALVFSFWIIKVQVPKEMSLEQKQEVLKEALMLFEEETSLPTKVLYEDEMIIIYMAPKKQEQATVNLEKIFEQF